MNYCCWLFSKAAVLAEFNFIYKQHFLPGFPEQVALYFVSGICAGLVFLLCLFGLRSTLVRDVKDLVSDLNEELKASRRWHRELMEDLYDEDVSDTSSFRRLTQSYRTTDVFNPSVLEMAEREAEQPRDLPNGDIWPHHDSSPYAIHKIKTYNWEKSHPLIKCPPAITCSLLPEIIHSALFICTAQWLQRKK